MSDEKEYEKIRYDDGESGWAEDLGNGQYKIANVPLCESLHFGDIVEFPDGADRFSGNYKIVKKGLSEKVGIRYESREKYSEMVDRCNLPEFKENVCLEGMVPGMAILCHSSEVNIEDLFKGIEGLAFDDCKEGGS